MELRTVDANKREVELVDQEVAELESIVAELKISKDALPAQERQLKEVLKDAKAHLRDREERMLLSKYPRYDFVATLSKVSTTCGRR